MGPRMHQYNQDCVQKSLVHQLPYNYNSHPPEVGVTKAYMSRQMSYEGLYC